MERSQPRQITLAELFFGVAFTFAAYYIFVNYVTARGRWLRKQIWIDQKTGGWQDLIPFSQMFASTRDITREYYYKYSKSGKLFGIPSTWSWTIIPPESLKEVLAKPDDEVSLLEILREIVSEECNDTKDIGADPFHLDVVRGPLTRKLHTFTSDVRTELILGFEDQWDAVNKDEWTSIHSFETCSNIVSRAANRIFSGQVLCRNKEFLHATKIYSQDSFFNAQVYNALPPFIRPFIRPFLARRLHQSLETAKKHAMPGIEARMQLHGSKEAPDDALQWIIDLAMKHPHPRERELVNICRRMLSLNMVAIFSTSMTIHNVLLDLHSQPNAAELVDILREECQRVITKYEGVWDKNVVNELVRMDSLIKESMRYSDFDSINVGRKVVKKGGITLSNGIHIPQGIRIGVAGEAIMHDEQHYESPNEFRPWRHLADDGDPLYRKGNVYDNKHQAAVSTSERFTPFGHGRHACPGRFFAIQEIKLMLAYIVMTYDVKLDGPPPPPISIGPMNLPNEKAMILIRLREDV